MRRRKSQDRTIQPQNRLNRKGLSQHWLLVAVFVFAVVVRTIALVLAADPFADDPDAYRMIAQTLAKTGVYGISSGDWPPKPTAFRPPLYPYLLSCVTSGIGGHLSTVAIGLLHVLCGALTAAATTWISKGLIEGDRIGKASIVAGGLVAIDPILVQQSTQLMTETLATLLSVLTIACWIHLAMKSNDRRLSAKFLVLSGLLALAYLCRPTFLVWSVMLVAASFMLSRKSNLSTRLIQSTFAASLVVIAVGGWTWRNVQTMGDPIWATSHGGYTLLLSNNESFYQYLRTGSWGVAWDAGPFLEAYSHRYDGDPNEAAFWNRDWSDFQPSAADAIDPRSPDQISENDDDRRCYLAARATIDRHPKTFLWSCVVRVGRLWSPMPHYSPSRGWLKVIMVGVYYLAMYVAVVLMLWRLGRTVFQPKWWAVWTLAITLSGVHAVYWTNIRMRAPIVPVIGLLAAGMLIRPSSTGVATANAEASDVAND